MAQVEITRHQSLQGLGTRLLDMHFDTDVMAKMLLPVDFNTRLIEAVPLRSSPRLASVLAEAQEEEEETVEMPPSAKKPSKVSPRIIVSPVSSKEPSPVPAAAAKDTSSAPANIVDITDSSREGSPAHSNVHFDESTILGVASTEGGSPVGVLEEPCGSDRPSTQGTGPLLVVAETDDPLMQPEMSTATLTGFDEMMISLGPDSPLSNVVLDATQSLPPVTTPEAEPVV